MCITIAVFGGASSGLGTKSEKIWKWCVKWISAKTLHRTIRRELVPAGWRVGPEATDDIEDIDIYSSSPKVAAYRHSSYPTLIVVDQAGKELARKTGAMGGKELADWIRSFRK